MPDSPNITPPTDADTLRRARELAMRRKVKLAELRKDGDRVDHRLTRQIESIEDGIFDLLLQDFPAQPTAAEPSPPQPTSEYRPEVPFDETCEPSPAVKASDDVRCVSQPTTAVEEGFEEWWPHTTMAAGFSDYKDKDKEYGKFVWAQGRLAARSDLSARVGKLRERIQARKEQAAKDHRAGWVNYTFACEDDLRDIDDLLGSA